jgi:WD40 repeat protein
METVGSQFSDAAMDLTLSGGRGGGKTNEVTACSIDGTVRTFDIRKGELRVDTLFGQQPVTAVENSADDRLVLATLPKTVALMDKTTG